MPENVTSMPRSVRQQADKANQLMNDLVAKAAALGGGDPPAAAAPVQPAPAPAPSSGVQGEPAAPPAPPAARPEDTVDYWKHRFSVLQGKYNAEVPVLQQQMAELREHINTISASPVQPSPAPAAEGISSEELDDYGQNFFDVVGRHAVRLLSPIIDRKISEALAGVTNRVTEVATTVEQSATERFFSDLAARVPNWGVLNQEQGWLVWLDEPDPFTGQPRQVLLNDARNKLDAKRAAALFTAYVQSKTPQAAGPGAVLPGAAGGQPRLGDFAEPGTVRVGAQGSGPAMPSTGRIWTPATVERLYADKRRGVYAGRENEFRQLEQDIQRAGVEGRYRQA